ncbi:MAG TPA: hypothetical protein VHC90_07995 [Bryobacteraceae bacterium]|nr:hypothetical protein [Bryobacteraceae bacterium]
MARRKAKKFSAEKEIRAIARERVGRVKAAQVIIPKSARKPKYPPRDPGDFET